MSGLLARCDFDEQRSGVTIGGAAVRPDVVVYLPGDRQLAVDAKAPMTDFLAAQGDGITAAERSALLRAHAKSLRGHVDALAGKGYWTAFEGSPELVVCFVPGEALLAAALAADPQLHEHATVSYTHLEGYKGQLMGVESGTAGPIGVTTST